MTCGTVFWSSFHLFDIAVNTFLLTANFLTFLHILFDMVLDLLLFTRKREYYFSHKWTALSTIGSGSNDDDDNAEGDAQSQVTFWFTSEIRDCLDLMALKIGSL